MTSNISRRKLLQASAVGAVGAVAGCVEALPAEIQCRAGRPTTFTFAPATPLDEVEFDRSEQQVPTEENNETEEDSPTDAELNRNKLVGILSRRASAAMEYDAIPQIKGVEVLDKGDTSFEFGNPIKDTEPIKYIIGSTGEYELRVENADGEETTAFTATGEYIRSGARAQQLSSNTQSEDTSEASNEWIAGLPLGPQEAEEIKQVLRDEGVAENPSEYTFNSYFYGEQISGSQLQQDGIDQILAEDWDNVLPISGLTQMQAVGLVAHARSQKPPVDIEIETSCRTLERRVSEFANDGESGNETTEGSGSGTPDGETPDENTSGSTENGSSEDSDGTTSGSAEDTESAGGE